MPHSIHIKSWVDRAIPDYFMLFVKAWIPYNAWYSKEIADETDRGTDKECINYICHHPNTYKNKILSYLNGTDEDSLTFKREIVSLHLSLLSHHIPDLAEAITFSNISIWDTSIPVAEGEYYKFYYKVERTEVGKSYHYDIRIEEKTTHATKFVKHYDKWNIDGLKTDPEFLQLSETVQKHTIELFTEVYPGKVCDIVLKPIRRGGIEVAPPHSIQFDESKKVYFVNDIDKISKVLIQLIYKLRCEIFHGSLDPTEVNQEVYKHLYVIQSMLIKELA